MYILGAWLYNASWCLLESICHLALLYTDCDTILAAICIALDHSTLFAFHNLQWQQLILKVSSSIGQASFLVLGEWRHDALNEAVKEMAGKRVLDVVGLLPQHRKVENASTNRPQSLLPCWDWTAWNSRVSSSFHEDDDSDLFLCVCWNLAAWDALHTLTTPGWQAVVEMVMKWHPETLKDLAEFHSLDVECQCVSKSSVLKASNLRKQDLQLPLSYTDDIIT